MAKKTPPREMTTKRFADRLAEVNGDLSKLEASEQQKLMTAALHEMDHDDNQPPMMDAIMSQTAHPDQPLMFQVTAFDPEGEELTFQLVGTPPAGASMDGQGNFSWTPTWAQLGNYTFTARATDPGGLSDSKSFTVSVTNQAPTLDPLLDPGPCHPDQPVMFTASAMDPDGDNITFTLVSGPAGAAMDADGNFSWTPTWGQIGNHTITVRATDPGGASHTRSRTLSVVNHAPVVDPLPAPATAHPGQPVMFTASANDPDGDNVTFTLSSGPAGASIDGHGNFDWTPTWAQLGTRTITIRGTDPGGLSHSRSASINVVNSAPTLSPLANQTATVGEPVMFTASGTDPDGDDLTYSLVSAPSGASIDGDGNFSWTPAAAGSYLVTVKVSDPGGLYATRSCTITVNDP
jgi:large repetitive protein